MTFILLIHSLSVFSDILVCPSERHQSLETVVRSLVSVCCPVSWPALTSAESGPHHYICHIPVYSWASCNKCDAVSSEAPIYRRHAENASHAESWSRFNLFNLHCFNRNAARMIGISTSLNVTFYYVLGLYLSTHETFFSHFMLPVLNHHVCSNHLTWPKWDVAIN